MGEVISWGVQTGARKLPPGVHDFCADERFQARAFDRARAKFLPMMGTIQDMKEQTVKNSEEMKENTTDVNEKGDIDEQVQAIRAHLEEVRRHLAILTHTHYTPDNSPDVA